MHHIYSISEEQVAWMTHQSAEGDDKSSPQRTALMVHPYIVQHTYATSGSIEVHHEIASSRSRSAVTDIQQHHPHVLVLKQGRATMPIHHGSSRPLESSEGVRGGVNVRQETLWWMRNGITKYFPKIFLEASPTPFKRNMFMRICR